jgi:hypothetical protein
MRKFVISLAAAGAALVVASPAAAQYYPQQQYGHGQPAYGYNGGYNGGYGYNGFNNGYGQVQSLQARLAAVQNRIRYAGGRGNSEGLRKEARNLQRRLSSSSYGGLNPYELNDISQRIARLEQRVNYAMAGRNRGYGYNSYGGYNGYNGYNNGQGYYGQRGDHGGDRDYDRDDDHLGYDRDDD